MVQAETLPNTTQAGAREESPEDKRRHTLSLPMAESATGNESLTKINYLLDWSRPGPTVQHIPEAEEVSQEVILRDGTCLTANWFLP